MNNVHTRLTEPVFFLLLLGYLLQRRAQEFFLRATMADFLFILFVCFYFGIFSFLYHFFKKEFAFRLATNESKKRLLFGFFCFIGILGIGMNPWFTRNVDKEMIISLGYILVVLLTEIRAKVTFFITGIFVLFLFLTIKNTLSQAQELFSMLIYFFLLIGSIQGMREFI